MKSNRENYCKKIFHEYLTTELPHLEISWFEVPLAEEPPDYYLLLEGCKYAVEITTLMEKIDVGFDKIPDIEIRSSLWRFVGDIEKSLKSNDLLHGVYTVGFVSPIKNFGMVKHPIEHSIVSYISRTRNDDSCTRETITIDGKDLCTISKAHSNKNAIYPIGPTNVKFQQQASQEIRGLLEEAIDDKTMKLRNITHPIILILHTLYFFGNRSMYSDAIPFLHNVSEFQCIFIIDDSGESFILYSEADFPL